MSGASLAETARAGLDRPVLGIEAGRLTLALRVAAVGLGIFALAAAVRLVAIDTYVTIDESRWVQRASDFSAYIGEGQPAETFMHPPPSSLEPHELIS